MKILVSLLFLFLLPFISTAQSQDWKQIDSPLQTSVKVHHQTSHGYLFGEMSMTREFYFSSDQGTSWVLLPNEFPAHNGGDLFIIREDANKYIYYANLQGIFRFDPATLASQIFLPVQRAEDFSFLKNGNVVVTTNTELFLFSANGAKLAEHEWWTHSAKILLDTLGQKHFVTNSLGASYFILDFNDDLSYISPKRSAPYDETIRKGGRMFRSKTYSDNGTSWIYLNLPANDYIDNYNIGEDGTLFYTAGSRLFISTDNGNTFSEETLPVDKIDYISSDAGGSIVISHSVLQDPEIYLSTDSGQNWTYIPPANSIPYSPIISAGIDENLYILTYGSKSYYKESEWSDWSINTVDWWADTILHRPVSLSNGANIALSTNYKIFETKDKGQSWEQYSDPVYTLNPYGLIEKSDALYSRYREELHYSLDYGKSWDSFISIDSDISFASRDPFLYSTDYSVYHIGNSYNSSGLDNQIMFYNFKTDEKIINPALDNAYCYATSFYDQTLYALTAIAVTPDGQLLSLSISVDRGASFSSKPLPLVNLGNPIKMKTDHLDNIYIYSNKKVLYSTDQGDSWEDISPDFPELFAISDLTTSYDNYIYLTTIGMGILKYKPQLKQAKKLIVSVVDDQNKNCSVDSAEPTMKGLNVLVNDTYLRAINESGEATFFILTSINEVKIIYNTDLYEECESTYIVEFEDTDSELHLDIPLKVLKYCADPVVGLSVPFLRRCFDNTYSGSVCNEGSIESINTEIEITLDPFFDFISASLPIKSINGQILVLDAGHLQPGDCQSFHFVVNVNCTAELGQEHCITAYSSTDSEDCGEIPTARDAYVDCQENIGAYDPNDKNIFVNGNRNQTYIEPGDKIEYLIRFQNTGTDTAFTVRIEDPITKKFNVSSLKPVAASHEYTWSVNNGMLVVLFEDIQLVDSFKNEPASHGFIKFEIQLDSLTLRGDDVKNLAGIFFDFNDAIITEEVVTVIGQPLNTKEHSFESITAFPNPANGLIYISGEALGDKPQDLMIYDIHGKLILSQKISQYNNSIDISKCAPGTYMLTMKSGERVYRGKVVKM
jgi:uncharacterized repeat protein (TIGR01451 family)